MTWEQIIDRMLKASETVPWDDPFLSGAQVLAETIEKIQHRIPIEETAVLLGIGAILTRQWREDVTRGLKTDPRFGGPFLKIHGERIPVKMID